MRKIIFLDMDGVANSQQGWVGRGYFRPKQKLRDTYQGYPKVWFASDYELNDHIDTDKPNWEFIHDLSQVEPHLIGIIRRLAEETEAEIVISSVWRMRKQVVAYFKELFAEFGWEDAPVIGATPECSSGRRGFEIKKWLEKHNFDYDADRYVILDDDSDMLQSQMKNFVHCNNRYGIGKDQFRDAKSILLGEDEDVNPPRQLNLFDEYYTPDEKFWSYED
jgi:hypothetical protein